MIKIKESKFNHVTEHYHFLLENGDEILVHERELEKEMLHESIQEKSYYPVFKETDTTDGNLKIIGFEVE